MGIPCWKESKMQCRKRSMSLMSLRHSYSNAFRSMKPPIENLPDSNYYHYALQLNIYRYILESEYEMPISRMCLGVFHPLSSHSKCVVIPRMETEIGLILEFEKHCILPMQPPWLKCGDVDATILRLLDKRRSVHPGAGQEVHQ